MSGTQQALLMVGSAAPSSPIIWNSADKSALIDLSSGDTIATRNLTGTSFEGVRGTLSQNSGKRIFEIEVTANPASNGGLVLGFGTTSASLNNYVGQDAFGWGYASDVGANSGNTTHSGFGPSFPGKIVTPTHRAGFAIDNPSGKAWMLIDGVSIQGDPVAGTSNPFAFTPGTAFFPMFSGFDNPAAVHLYGRTSDIAFPVSGYTAWGEP